MHDKNSTTHFACTAIMDKKGGGATCCACDGCVCQQDKDPDYFICENHKDTVGSISTCGCSPGRPCTESLMHF